MRKTFASAAVALLLVAAAAYYFCSNVPRESVGANGIQPVAFSAGRLVPLGQVDHSPWDRLLKKYVNADGLVNYAAWKASAEDRAALGGYLAALGRGDPRAKTSKEGTLAFWINAYNALTIHGILQVYPTSSIRNHTAKLFGYNIWKDLPLTVGGKDYSLNDIEHKILRKLGEPRIHFAIVCASISCPRLRGEAYTPQRLEDQLADNARDFFSRERNFRADPARRAVRVSAILDWFGDDFAPTPQQALKRLAGYMPDEAARRMIAKGDFSVKYLDYDWSLNEQ